MVYRPSVLVALILLVTAWSYRSVQTAGFVYEDHNGGPEETIYAPWQGWAAETAAFQAKHLGRWNGHIPLFRGLPTPRALTTLSYRLNAWLAPSAAGFHLVNLALHLLNIVLLAALVWPLLGEWATLAIGIFALHPLQSEAVMGIAYRGELLATTCLFLALLAAARIASNRMAVILAIACGGCALLAKETTAAVLVLAWPWIVPPGRRLVPWAVWSVALLGAGAMVLHTPTGLLHGWAYARHVVLQVAGFWVLSFRAAVPLWQTVDLDLAHVSASVVMWPLYFLTLALVGYWLFAVGSVHFWITAGWVWMAACLLVRIVSPSSELLHEHAMYLPLAGLGVSWAGAWSGQSYWARD